MKVLNSKILVVMSMCLLAAPLAAKADEVESTDGKIAMGFQGGITVPEFKVKNSSLSNTYQRKDGWTAGVFFEFGIWTITLRPEVNYTRKGWTIANVADVENEYMDLAALVKFSPFGDGVVSPYILVGPQWSKQLKSDISSRAGATRIYVDTTDEWDLAAVGAIGLDFNLSEYIALGLQGRYIFGFRDVDSSATEVRQRAFHALANLTIQNAF